MELFVKGNQLVGDVAEVVCPYCDAYHGKGIQIIPGKHFTKHKKRITDVRIEFPDHITMTFKELQEKQIKGQQQAKETKIVKCFYSGDSDCPGEDYTVLKTTANYVICDTCKKLGKDNPDGRTKPEAVQRRATDLQKKYGLGITNAAHIPGVTQKKKETSTIRHGGVGFDSPVLAEKSRTTMEEKYGFRNIMQSEEGPKRYIAAFKKKYGTTIVNPMQILEVAKQVSETKKSYYFENDHHTKGKTYTEMYGEEKAQQLIEDRRISGVESYLKDPCISEQQEQLFDMVKELFPIAKMEHKLIGKTDDYGKFGYALDIAIQEYKLCIEFDGYYHTKKEQIEHDKNRDEVLKTFGWSTIRFSNIPTKEELIQKIKSVL